MFMRYRGKAIGHKATQDIENFLTEGLDLQTQCTTAANNAMDDEELADVPVPRRDDNEESGSEVGADDEIENEDGEGGGRGRGQCEDGEDLGFDDL